MKRKSISILMFIFRALSITVVLCGSSMRIFLHGCLWWECAPKRIFHVRDWELPASLFPDGALVGNISASSEGTGETERGTQTIFWTYGGAGYRIYRYATSRRAISKYDFEVNHMVDYETNMPWAKPTQLTFHSATADSVHIACGNGLQGTECGFTGRYQEYVIYYSSSIDEERMTFKDFEEILIYINEQISNRLYP